MQIRLSYRIARRFYSLVQCESACLSAISGSEPSLGIIKYKIRGEFDSPDFSSYPLSID